MDFMDILRLAGIFGQPPMSQGPTLSTNMPGAPTVLNAAPAPTMPVFQGNPDANPMPGLPGQEDPFQRIMNFRPEHPATDALMEMYKNFPQRNDPGVGRKILGVLAAFGRGGPQNTENVLYAPYYRQLEEYQNKLKPLEVMARAEDRDIDNQRMLMLGAAQRYTGAQRAEDYSRSIDVREKDLERKTREGEAKLGLEERKVRVREHLMENPNHKLITGNDGELYAFNPVTKEMTPTGLKGTDLNDMDKLMWAHKYRMSEIELRNQGTIEAAKVRGDEARETKRTPGAPRAGSGTGPRPMTNLERLRQRQLNAQIILDKNPEFRDTVIRFDELKQPYIVPGSLSPEQTEVLQRRLLNDVYDEDGDPVTHQNLGNKTGPTNKTGAAGGAVIPPGANRNTVQPATQPHTSDAVQNPNKRGASINQPAGTIEVISPDGQRGWIPMKQLEAALAQGYKKVR